MNRQEIEAQEDLEDEQEARDYQARKAAGLLTPDEAKRIPFDRAMEEIEAAWEARENDEQSGAVPSVREDRT